VNWVAIRLLEWRNANDLDGAMSVRVFPAGTSRRSLLLLSNFETSASVVNIKEAIEPAFFKAVRTILVGSMTPAFARKPSSAGYMDFTTLAVGIFALDKTGSAASA